jgi:uncharacterized damage-inducible protein DinB
MENPQYPVGKFSYEKDVSPGRRKELIDELASLPQLLRTAVGGLSRSQIDLPYRAGGWTVREVVHHLADGFMNWYIRIKLALTENDPLIKPFDQEAWSRLSDARTASPDLSVAIFEALTARAVNLLRSISPADFSRTMRHPERGQITVDYALQTLCWHNRHHIAHIESLRRTGGEALA